MDERLDRIKSASEQATMIARAVGDAVEISEANSVQFAQAVFEEFSKDPDDRDEQRLVRYMNLALKSRAVELTYKRFRYDAAERARKYVTELRAINEGEGEDAEKTLKAIRLLFGERPEHTTFQPA
jgi:hypothetical protein